MQPGALEQGAHDMASELQTLYLLYTMYKVIIGTAQIIIFICT